MALGSRRSGVKPSITRRQANVLPRFHPSLSRRRALRRQESRAQKLSMSLEISRRRRLFVRGHEFGYQIVDRLSPASD